MTTRDAILADYEATVLEIALRRQALTAQRDHYEMTTKRELAVLDTSIEAAELNCDTHDRVLFKEAKLVRIERATECMNMYGAEFAKLGDLLETAIATRDAKLGAI